MRQIVRASGLILTALLLILPAALAGSYSPQAQQVRSDSLVATAVATLVAVICAASGSSHGGSRPGMLAIAAASCCALPLAGESCGQSVRAAAALALTALAGAYSRRERPTSGLLVSSVAASAMNPAGLLVPLANTLTRIGGERRRALLIWMASAVAVVIGGWASQQDGMPPGLFGHAVARDLMLLIPLITLGALGAVCGEPPRFVQTWAALAVGGLILCMAGVRIDVRSCTLPFIWLAPAGMGALQNLFASRSGWMLKLIAVACACSVLVLAFPVIVSWGEAVLLSWLVLSR